METNKNEVVDRPAELQVFDPLKAEIEVWKKKNADMVFAYDTAKGEAEARSHIYKLRQTKGKINSVHKEAKAKALAMCQAVDSERNWCLGEIEGMIKVHMDPIDAKVKRQQEAEAAAAEKLQQEKEAEEAAKLKEIEDREKAVKVEEEKVAKIKATAEQSARAEEQRLSKQRTDHQTKVRAEEERLAGIAEANEKMRQNEEAKQIAKVKIEEKRLAAERQKFEVEKQAEANAKRREREAAETKEREIRDKQARIDAVKKGEAEAEERRVADEEHRRYVHNKIMNAFNAVQGNETANLVILNTIIDGKIPHVKIIY